MNGQIVRVYEADRFTVWALESGRSFSCYEALTGDVATMGDVVAFGLSASGDHATGPRRIDPARLTESERRNLVRAVPAAASLDFQTAH